MLKEFKQFIVKGNAMDLAVGVIIGAAFGKIVTSLVNDIIMPFIGLILGNVNLTALKWVLRKAAADGTGELAVTYGQFIQATIDFVLIAFVIFMMVRAINKLRKKEVPKPAEPVKEPEPTKEELLLGEIRDLLKK
ncbi:MAG: large-conductance mechanosensitive channel protein MscL [Eubacteriales bacterium]|jgi:large conductance mechanosensitive channel|nr:large-conductance mechanosensitive channel protein MscL [Eubacteriales bacterium]